MKDINKANVFMNSWGTVRKAQVLRPAGVNTFVEVARHLQAVPGDVSDRQTTLWFALNLQTGGLLWGEGAEQFRLTATATAEELEVARQAMGML